MDARFLGALLTRLLREMLSSSSTANFDMSDVTPMNGSGGIRSAMDVARMVNRCAGEGYSLHFVHRDADHRDMSRVEQWMGEISSTLSPSVRSSVVFVVPIRMSEAWALVDGEALRRTLGVSWPDSELGVPDHAHLVEGIQNPKALLSTVVRRLSGPKVDIFARLGSEVSLQRLLEVPALHWSSQSLRTTLASQGVISQ